MIDKTEFLDKIKTLSEKYDLDLIGRAYDKAVFYHDNQFRKSGEPYVTHPISVAIILAEIGMDSNTIAAALLHDLIEDTSYTEEQLKADFGDEIFLFVDGVTKLGTIKYETKEEVQAENLRKLFLAMSVDIRVLIIKLADRLHNMRTLEHMSQEKKIEKSKETIEIYAPLASRLGIYAIKFELEDLALKYLNNDDYNKLLSDLEEKQEQRTETIAQVIADIKDELDSMDIKYEIKGRTKHLFSIYKKMKIQKKQIEEIFDLTAIRIVVDSVKDCYTVLGIIHTMWKPIPGRFKDYIAVPKTNLYQSLHTTVFSDIGEPFEIQIRTHEMHRIAEHGIAAHWKYKEGSSTGHLDNDEMKLAWLRQTLELHNESSDSKEFMENLKMDLFSSQVYVFTPRGDIMELPIGATPLDFAFKIHSDVGCKCVGARINGKLVPIDHTLENGNIVEIVTSSHSSGPSVDWLRIAKSSAARNKIRAWLKKESKSDDIDKGKDALDKYLRKKGYSPQDILKTQYINRAIKAMNMSNTDELYVQLYKGGSLLGKFTNLILGYIEEENKEIASKEEEIIKNDSAKQKQRDVEDRRRRENSGVIVKGVDNLMIRISRCCNPVPGDNIIGFITKGRGVTVHRVDCSNIVCLTEEDKNRLIEVEWEDLKVDKVYNADICIIASDRKGLFADVSRTCEDLDINISGVNAKSLKDGSINMTLTISLTSTHQMQKVLRVLRNIPSVDSVYRAKA